MKNFNKKSIVAALVLTFTLGFTGSAMAATLVNLGSASNFAVLAGTTITNTGASVINGDLGLSPGSSVTGSPNVSGTKQIVNAAAVQAKADLVEAYNNAAGQATAFTVPTELGGTTKTTGVYDSLSGTFEITGTLTLDAQNDPNAVFIFKTASTLVTAVNSNVVLTGGAQASNVFWQVGSSATLQTYSTFKGTILALTSITVTTGVNMEGRVFAQNGAVTLDTDIITAPSISPKLPDTGSGPVEGSLPWDIFMASSILIIVLSLTAIILKKTRFEINN